MFEIWICTKAELKDIVLMCLPQKTALWRVGWNQLCWSLGLTVRVEFAIAHGRVTYTSVAWAANNLNEVERTVAPHSSVPRSSAPQVRQGKAGEGMHRNNIHAPPHGPSPQSMRKANVAR